jgi:SAM-dependent methyltransferase
MEKNGCWFETWFDSDYYHLLYNNRNQGEAEAFIHHLLRFLNLPPKSRALDLACGKGRHSLVLAESGLDVLGVDLSENSIVMAKSFENEHLHFQTGDMRKPQGNLEFDVVFNLFTSFGYFENEEENLQTLLAINQSLKPGGKLVIDFMNSEKVVKNLLPHHELQRGSVLFLIDKSLENKVISKKIRFTDNGKNYNFEERVQALTRSDFESYFQKTGFQVLNVFGNYALDAYQSEFSERMIFIVEKVA